MKMQRDLKSDHPTKSMLDRYVETINKRIETTCVTMGEFRK